MQDQLKFQSFLWLAKRKFVLYAEKKLIEKQNYMYRITL